MRRATSANIRVESEFTEFTPELHRQLLSKVGSVVAFMSAFWYHRYALQSISQPPTIDVSLHNPSKSVSLHAFAQRPPASIKPVMLNLSLHYNQSSRQHNNNCKSKSRSVAGCCLHAHSRSLRPDAACPTPGQTLHCSARCSSSRCPSAG